MITRPGGVTKRETLDGAGYESGNGCEYSTVLLCHLLVVGTHYAPVLNYGHVTTGIGALHGGEMVTHTGRPFYGKCIAYEGSIPSTSTN